MTKSIGDLNVWVMGQLVSMVAQGVKLLLAMTASHNTVPVQVLVTPFLIQLPTNTPCFL